MANDTGSIRRTAQILDAAIENRDINGCLSCFTEDAAMEFMGLRNSIKRGEA